MNTPSLETENPETRRWKALALMQSAFSYATLSNLLRVIGAGVLVASVSIFLLKGWEAGNDVQRYAMLLAHTILLSITGLGIGHWVGESKGARLFLALSLISSLVNYAVLGGLIYSQVQWDNGLLDYPGFAHWQAGSLTAALTTAAAALVLLAPIAWIAFLTLARRSAAALTLLFIASGSLLLVPLRQTEPVALIIALSALLLVSQAARLKRKDTTLATPEGRFARWILFAPLFLLAGRGLYLYSADLVMYTVICGSVYLAMRQISMDRDASPRTVIMVNRASALPAMATAAGITSIAVDANWLMEPLYLPVFAAAASALFIDISLRAPAGGDAYRRFAGLTVATAMLANLWLFPGLLSAAACMLSGLPIAVYGYSVQQRLVFATGLITFVAGVAHQCHTVFVWFDWGNWAVLALIGMVAIVTGSILERHGTVLRARLTNWRRSIASWQN